MLKQTFLARVPRKLIKLFVFTALILMLALAAFIGYLAFARNQPLQLPAPTGSYPVGRVEFNWVESSVPDPLADRPDTPRELVVWVWYPAAQKGTTPAPYLPAAWAQARDMNQGVGVLIESNFQRIKTHAFENVPLAASPAKFPILVMEPGMGPMVTDYTVLAENLASHGYLVVGINPTDTANWTVFKDGRVVLRSNKGAIPDSDTPQEAEADGSRILAVWVQDEEFVLDRLAFLNTDTSSSFRQRLDLNHIGIWGHSFGGATAVAVCQTDPRCKQASTWMARRSVIPGRQRFPGRLCFSPRITKKGVIRIVL